jgi:hypothetical protein
MRDPNAQTKSGIAQGSALRRVVLGVLLAAFAAGAGYVAGSLREPVLSRLPVAASVTPEYRSASDSFSEIAQARAVLEAAVNRHVEAARFLIARETLPGWRDSAEWPARADRPVQAAIQLLEAAITDLEGFVPEAELVPTLLSALKRERLYDRWINVYLDVAYRHPTHRIVRDWAEEALRLAQIVGRQVEVQAALRYLADIPAGFAAERPTGSHLAAAGREWTNASTQ